MTNGGFVSQSSVIRQSSSAIIGARLLAHPGIASSDVSDLHDGPAKASLWAWGLCWLMFVVTVLNYMDRQAIAIVGPKIKAEFGLTNADFGWVLAAFAMSYAFFQVPAGYLVDRWNVRWVYAGAVTWWSLAAIAAAYSPTLGFLMAFRAVLGLGESFNWPCALRATRTILPPASRSLGNGIFNSGAAVGAVLTPLIVTPISEIYGWRKAFLIVGTLGFGWVIVWLVVLSGKHRAVFAGRKLVADKSEIGTRLSSESRLTFQGLLASSFMIAAGSYRYGFTAIWLAIAWFMIGLLFFAWVLPEKSLEGSDWAKSLGEVVRVRRFWVLMVVTVSINVCWHFLLNWLPTYIKEDLTPPAWLQSFAVPVADALGVVFGNTVSPKTVGTTLLITLPFLAADLGNLIGGGSSRILAGRGFSAVNSRLIVMGVCTLVISSGSWVGRTGNSYMAIYLLSFMAMGTAAFMANYFSFAQEVSGRNTGLIVGILGAFGNLFAAGFLPFAGAVKDATGGFGPIFVTVALMPFVGLAALVAGWGKGTVDE